MFIDIDQTLDKLQETLTTLEREAPFAPQQLAVQQSLNAHDARKRQFQSIAAAKEVIQHARARWEAGFRHLGRVNYLRQIVENRPHGDTCHRATPTPRAASKPTASASADGDGCGEPPQSSPSFSSSRADRASPLGIFQLADFPETSPSASLARPFPGRDYLPTDEAADYLGVRPQTLRKHHHESGSFRGVRPVKLGRLLRWPLAEIQALLKGVA